MDKAYDEEIDKKFLLGHCLLLDHQFAPPHFHQSVELVYVESGEITAHVQDETLIIGAGNVLLLGSNVMHSIYSEYGISCYVLTIPMSVIPSLSDVFSDNTFGRTICRDTDGYFLNLFKTAYSTISDKGAFFRSHYSSDVIYTKIVTGISETILYSVIHITGMVKKDKSPDASIFIMEYIQNHYLEDINVTSIAQKLGYTPQGLTRIFKASTNMSVKEYITSLRIQLAGNYIIEGQKTQEISDKLGFNCTRSFFRAFSKIYNCTPSEYKYKVQQKEQTTENGETK